MTAETVTLNRNGLLTPDRLKSLILPGAFLGLIAIATIISPSFLSVSNLQDVLTQAAPLMIVVIGQTFVILVRGLDLSVASLMATVAVIATAFDTQDDAMIPVIFVSAISFCVVVGFINGWLVTKRNVSPFLATLAMMIVLQGLRFYYTKGAPSGILPEGFRFLGTGQILGIPVNVIGFAILFVVLSFVLKRTVFGRKVYTVGGNPSSADLVGINSHNITILCYVICSVLAGIAGLLLVGYVGSVDNFVGRGYELDSIVAAVVGGVALSGGKGNLLGAVLGALILVLIFNLVIIVGLPVQAQMVIKGVIIVAAAAYFAKSLR
ncbi:ABC transporter permease [Roseibium sp.]|uniref:ABC transporter permease n=1 Tax=Roseibium sp. TaxID=1936156 RepID=UPI003D136639